MPSKKRKVELLRKELKTPMNAHNMSETWWKNIVLLMAEIITEEEEES